MRGLTRGLVPGYVLLCLLLGGASAAGLWANVLLQLLAVLLLFAALAARPESAALRPARQLLALLVAAIAVVLFQLVPLPPALWTALPGREHVAEGFALVGRDLPWLTVSLAPRRTIAAALWLLPAAAVLVAMLRTGARPPAIAWAMVAVVVLSVLIGAMQLAEGEGSRWYFYAITNPGVTVGFFANANHLATLLVSTVPFLAALWLSARSRRRETQKSAGLFVMVAGLFGLVLIGLVINGSLAGLGLMLPVIAATLTMALRRSVPLWSIALIALLTIGSVAAIFSGRFDNNLIHPDEQTNVISRYTSFTVSAEAAKDHFPFGSGIGTFRPVYQLYEDPERVTNTFVNHVHSDWIELVLETGLPGLALLVLFLIWWVRRALAIWRADEPDYFARAATIASAAMLAHSLVDYPLRTAAMGAVFAACLAMMAGGRSGTASRTARKWQAKRPARHLSAG